MYIILLSFLYLWEKDTLLNTRNGFREYFEKLKYLHEGDNKKITRRKHKVYRMLPDFNQAGPNIKVLKK